MPLTPQNSPTGFRLWQPGGQGNAQRRRRPVLANRAKDLMVGDAYVLDAGGNASRLTAAADDGAPIGIVEGIDLNPIGASPQGPVSQDYIPAAEAGAIIGIEDDQAVFEVMDADALGFVAATDTGKDAAILDADGSQQFRRSRQSIVTDAVNKQFYIIGLVPSPADNPDAVPFNRVLVRVRNTTQNV